MYKKPKMCEDQKRVWGIKAVAGSYLGLLSSVSILSAHRTIIRPILWPAAFYASAAVYHLKISDLVHTPAGSVGHLIKTDICIFAILVCTQTIVHTVTILVWTNYLIDIGVHKLFSHSANNILAHHNMWPEEMDFDFMFNYFMTYNLFMLKEIFLVVQIALKIDLVV